MRNLIFLGIFASLSLTSCSDDDIISEILTSELKLVTSSNTTGKISYTNLLSVNPTAISFSVNGTDNDGIFYNTDTDEIILASRTNNRLETYSGLKNAVSSNMDNLMLANFSASTDFNNAREIAVSGDKIVVTQDQAASNGDTNKLFVYQKSATGYTLLNQYTLNFKVWGIHVNGNDLYAVADLTSDIVVFNNFFSLASGSIMPSKRVTIENLIRTHGITYSAMDNVMILTDVASAADATDGGLVIINNFSTILNSTANMGTISTTNQIRLYGSNTTLGNPVDVAYDYDTNRIYVAERANGGGNVLTFNFPSSSGNIAPISTRAEPGVAAVYLVKK
ncbi:hypothetical protein LXD69_14690 [Flavobacterium sediminilitoris]|uniref:Lipoprotein n=1 Tax=Flavobacterium sediminilitoris TaxID=2024526 RepID=A0ABY4HKQ7_9FLAO|nr:MULTISPECIES: hypothetical protein [Flavobacterium]UOX33280.1 hypothetical protein LXD69_14690 [Flavobacterium sediminilitoris]